MANAKQDARAQRGHRAVELHPDLGPNGIDFQTAAIDVVADILHAAADAGIFDEAESDGFNTSEFLARALRTFEGDAEDEAPPMRIYRLGNGDSRTRPRALEDYGLAAWYVRDEKTGSKVYPKVGEGATFMSCQDYIERNGGTL